jgi:4-amino-4-deoxy-L-arabinose transferase-like glycosyltransferase
MSANITRQQVFILLSLSLVVSAIARLPVLPITAFSGDEGIYLLISREILDGVLPYDGSFEHKPAGLYYLFALAQLLFGQEVYAIRLLAIFATAATAFFLAITLMAATGSGLFPAACTAVIYAISSLGMGGLETNSELLLNGYLSAALALYHRARLTDQYSPIQGCLIGLLLGLMFHTNYLGGFLIVGIGVGYLVAVIAKGDFSRHRIDFSKNVAVLSAGFLGVSFLLLVPLAVWGDLSAYFGKQIGFLSAYRDSDDISLTTILVKHQPYYPLLFVYMIMACFSIWIIADIRSYRHFRERALLWSLLHSIAAWTQLGGRRIPFACAAPTVPAHSLRCLVAGLIWFSFARPRGATVIARDEGLWRLAFWRGDGHKFGDGA